MNSHKTILDRKYQFISQFILLETFRNISYLDHNSDVSLSCRVIITSRGRKLSSNCNQLCWTPKHFRFVMSEQKMKLHSQFGDNNNDVKE